MKMYQVAQVAVIRKGGAFYRELTIGCFTGSICRMWGGPLIWEEVKILGNVGILEDSVRLRIIPLCLASLGFHKSPRRPWVCMTGFRTDGNQLVSCFWYSVHLEEKKNSLRWSDRFLIPNYLLFFVSHIFRKRSLLWNGAYGYVFPLRLFIIASELPWISQEYTLPSAECQNSFICRFWWR